MHQAHGFVEFRQLGEWYGVIDAGTLLVPNLHLSILLLSHAERLGQAAIPGDASVAIMERVSPIQGQQVASASLTFRQLGGLHADEDQERRALLDETLFHVLLDLCRVLTKQFGEDGVRLVLYFD